MRLVLLLLAAALVLACGWLLWPHEAPAPREGAAPAATLSAAAPVPEPARPSMSAASESTVVAERTSAAVLAARGGCLLQFRTADGAPLAHADFVLRQEGALLARGESDGAGEVLVAPAVGMCSLVVSAAGHAPHQELLEPTAGVHEIVLPAGALLAGQVLVDGAPPGVPVTLELCSVEPWGLAEPGFATGEASGVLALRCTPDGRFACAGLAADWSGELRVTEEPFAPLSAAGESNDGAWSLRLERPRSDIIVHLRRLPYLRGRVLAADGTPLAAAAVAIGFHEGNGSSSHGATMDSDGRFRCLLRDLEFDLVSVEVIPPGQPWHRVQFTRESIPADFDLGDILLPPLRELEVQVLEPGGAPVAGALLSCDGRTWGSPADARGACSIQAPLEEFTLHARAARHRKGSSLVPEHARGPILVLLEPTNLLTVRVLDAQGLATQGALVQLQADGALFQDEDGLQRVADYLEAGQHRGSSWSTQFQEVEILPDESGTVRVFGLTAGLQLQLRIQPPASPVVHEELLPPLPATGELERVLRLDLEARSLRGRVIDAGGAPLADARVFYGPEGASQWDAAVAQASSDLDGRFTLRFGAALASGSLRIERRGFVTLVLHEYTAPEAETEFRLQPAVPLRVRIIDAAGVPVAAEVSVRFGQDLFAEVQTLEPGLYRVDNLPPGPVSVSATVGGREHRREHDTAQPELQIQVPVSGALRAYLPPFELAAEEWLMLKLVEVGTEEILWLQHPAARIAGGIADFRRVSPGTYRATMYRFDQGFAPASAEMPVVVLSGQTTEVRF